MSDVSRGPGWWLATDGKWYHPLEAGPDGPTPMPAPQGEPVKLEPELAAEPRSGTGELPQAVPSLVMQLAGKRGEHKRPAKVKGKIMFASGLLVVAAVVAGVLTGSSKEPNPAPAVSASKGTAPVDSPTASTATSTPAATTSAPSASTTSATPSTTVANRGGTRVSPGTTAAKPPPSTTPSTTTTTSEVTTTTEASTTTTSTTPPVTSTTLGPPQPGPPQPGPPATSGPPGAILGP